MGEHHTHSLETPFENSHCPIGIIHQTMEGMHYPCFMYISQHIHVFNSGHHHLGDYWDDQVHE